jgi:hypothetical protein
VPLGSYVMDWPSEYETLANLLFSVYQQYRGPGTNPNPPEGLILDFEYKKVTPGRLLVKQVRPLPGPSSDNTLGYVLNEPSTYWVYQSENSDALANHRLKCFFTLQTKNLRLSETNLQTCLYTQARFESRGGSALRTLEGNMSEWPGAWHTLTNDPSRGWVLRDGWTVGEGAGQWRLELTSVIPARPAGGPLFLPQADIRKWLRVTYTTPVPAAPSGERRASTTSEEVQLVNCPELASLKIPAGQAETFGLSNLVQFQVAFLDSTNSAGPPLGIDKNLWGTYPAALSPWMHTRISGLTAEPLELRGYWSQSARAGHKFRYAWYVFEPDLEPDLDARQREELKAANIQLIHVAREAWPGGAVEVSILGFDGQFRAYPELSSLRRSATR